MINLAKRKAKKSVVKTASKKCSWGNCSGSDWFGTLIAEAAIYGFFYCGLKFLESTGNLWWNALVLFVLVNVAWFACPVVKKHFY
mgnify:FL=1